MTEYNCLYKILLIGDSGVGKSTIMTKFTHDKFSEVYVSTIGVDFSIKNVEYENLHYKLQIWDTAGQERFKSITSHYYRGSHCCLVVFSLTDLESFHNVGNWINNVHKLGNSDVLIILVGTKSDIKHLSEITPDMIYSLKKQENIEYFETSSKYGHNINELFQYIIKTLNITKADTNNNNNKKIKFTIPNVTIKKEEQDEQDDDKKTKKCPCG
jgi:Ras-related protein Rab-1A